MRRMGSLATRWQTHWQKLRPVTRAALVFVPVVCLGVNVALPNLPWQPQYMTSLSYTAAWLGGIAHKDSWAPMRIALAFLDGADLDALPAEALPGDGSARSIRPRPLVDRASRDAETRPLLYQEVFFERGLKLQYPPTSLLFVDALRRPPLAALSRHDDPASDEALNEISWLAVLVTVLLSTAVLLVGSGQFADRSAPLRGPDRFTLALLGVLAGVCFYPLVRGYYLGQVQTFIDALTAGLVLTWMLGRQATAGILAGIICLIKPQLGLLVLWAALRRRWRFATGFVVTVGIAGCISLLAYGFANHVDYLEVLSFIGRHGEGFHPNQSVNGLLHRMIGSGNNLSWETQLFAPFDVRVYGATLASSLLLIGLALFFRRDEHERASSLDLLIAIVSVTLASPVAWTHHYAVLLPVFALAVPATFGAESLSRSRFMLLGLSYLLIANNFRVLNRLADTSLNFLQSYVFFGGLLLLVLLYRLRHARADASTA